MERLRVKQSPIQRAAWVLALISSLCACANQTERAVQIATHGGLTAQIVQGSQFRHEIFTNLRPRGTVLFVFIEGDGSPWSHGGQEPSADPTPHRPLALELAAGTPRSVLYVGRPCYFSVHADAGCTPSMWTAERYSAEVVASLAAVVNRFAANNGFDRLVLIGYSGGGALAVLMAPQIPSTRAVVTIAADLDVAAWSAWHHYLPLEGSLNPALQAPLDPDIRQWHMVGDLDINVPERVSRGYLDKVSADQVWRFPGFDHSCCWVEQWPTLLARIEAGLNQPR